ncbi:Neural-cadherin [Chionoecetes opilio]|uniref:Neural-cadherin n=1 Tax=Chionoecetes opilio TaxID=41210 RepID=A0A8J4Y976_CHIOP|nr:Neural-cadherin [Chionoecetes opilio]
MHFDHMLLYHKQQLSTTLGVGVRDAGVITCQEDATLAPNAAAQCVGGCWVGLGDAFSVVDANSSAVVGPQVVVRGPCSCATTTTPPLGPSCSPNTCLNGGRCLTTSSGTRCICPHGTRGPRCKVLCRRFQGSEEQQAIGGGVPGGEWAWVPPIPPCAQVHVSVEVLTTAGTAALLYSGPEHGVEQGPGNRQLLLELREGRPALQLHHGNGLASLSLTTVASLADNTWHRIDLVWKHQVVEMIVDLCLGGSWDEAPPTSEPPHNHTSPSLLPGGHACRGTATLPQDARVLSTKGVLQVGGIAHPHHVTMDGNETLSRPPHFHGCIRNLRVNGELVDLGSTLLSRASPPGCAAADCLARHRHCGTHARSVGSRTVCYWCRGSPGSLRCECLPGWGGADCASPTTPTTFLHNSYVKLALSFSPLAYTTSIALRYIGHLLMRLWGIGGGVALDDESRFGWKRNKEGPRGSTCCTTEFRTLMRSGELVVLSSQHGRDSWSVQLAGGRLCSVLHLHPRPPSWLCLSRATLTDGRWHSLTATR